MQDREFEKQVQQKMQELRFAPDPGIWARVQADISKKKRRRPIIFFLLMAGLLGGFAWLYFDGSLNGVPETAIVTPGNSNNNEETKSNDNTGTSAPSSNERNDITKINNESKNDINNKDIKTNDVAANDIKSGERVDDLTHKNISRSDNNISKTPLLKKSRKADNLRSTSNPKKQSGSIMGTYVAPKVLEKKANQLYDEALTPVTTKKKDKAADSTADKQEPVKQQTLITDSLNSKPADKIEKTAKPDELKKPDDISKPLDSAAKKPFGAKNTPAKKRNWGWGISAGAGIAGAGQTIFHGKSLADAIANPTNIPTRDSMRYTPMVKAGPAFNLGGYVSKGINKKLRVKAGLNYEYFSTKSPVGDFIDSFRLVNQGSGNFSVVNRYYRPGDQNSYTNTYHFISLPVSLQWQLNRSAKFGIVWENGVSVSRMIAANALQYDGITRTYYKDKNENRKTQWMGSSSLLFRFTTKSNRNIYAGPEFRYAFTSLLNDADDKHLRYGGLKVMMGFNKK